VQQRKIQNSQIEIVWAGKSEAKALAHADSSLRMKLDRARSINQNNAEHLIIEGDNLDALKLLRDRLKASVRAIYIDPPYNTGNGFVYSDRRQSPAWLSMMLPRLMLARELMRDDAAIFISIDDHEVDKLRLLMAEVFGEENFVAQICVQSNPRGRQAERHFATVHEYLVVYAKDHGHCRLAGMDLTEDQLDEFSGTDENGRRYRLLGLRQRGAASLREDRPAMHYPIFVEPESGNVSLEKQSESAVAVYPKKSTGQAGRWMWGKQKARESVDLLEARLITRRNEFDIFVRDYLDDENGNCRKRKVKTIWDEKDLNYQNGKRQLKELLGEAPVDYPKPLGLLRKIIAMVDEKDAIFLDFFAGSGTLGHAVLEANTADGGARKFVLIQLPEAIEHAKYTNIADICRDRVARAIEKLDTKQGFSYYTLTR
jgi:adenine-specific DNA-methyltransferase